MRISNIIRSFRAVGVEDDKILRALVVMDEYDAGSYGVEIRRASLDEEELNRAAGEILADIEASRKR